MESDKWHTCYQGTLKFEVVYKFWWLDSRIILHNKAVRFKWKVYHFDEWKECVEHIHSSNIFKSSGLKLT